MSQLSNETIAVFGGSSMIGRAIINHIPKTCKVLAPTHDELNLEDFVAVNNYFYTHSNIDIAILAQGFNGNILFNKRYPVDIFKKTADMAMNILTMCQKIDVSHVISMISSCSYPSKDTLKEEDYFNGRPDYSVSAHGFAKRLILEYAEQLYKQYGLQHTGLIVNTVYGPFDNYNPEKTKVIGSLIKKFSDAKKNNLPKVQLLGTGENRREFIYCDDVGKYLIKLLQYDKELDLINIGSGIDYSIRETAELIKSKIGYQGDIEWSGENGGQYQKLLDVSKMKSLFGELEFIDLNTGLDKTLDWFYKNEIYS